jgi:hypothetical protein
MQLKLLAKLIKDQVILIHFGFFFFDCEQNFL